MEGTGEGRKERGQGRGTGTGDEKISQRHEKSLISKVKIKGQLENRLLKCENFRLRRYSGRNNTKTCLLKKTVTIRRVKK